MQNRRPNISVIMPTFNSERTIEKALKSIRHQNYEQRDIEVLVVDGGSTDLTRQIAIKYGCLVLDNPKRQQEYAKGIGILKATGKYLIFLDSDEVLENSEAVANRIEVFSSNSGVKFIHSSGYKRPEGASTINDYINNFSDPFTYFMQRIATEHGKFIKSWKHRFPDHKDYNGYTVFRLSKSSQMPVVDMCAGNTVDAVYLKSIIGDERYIDALVPKLFYLIVEGGSKVALLVNDPILHYSADTLDKFVGKIRWRIVVNTHYKEIPGTGFSNREEFQPRGFKLKKYLFIIYGLSVVLPMIDSINIFLNDPKPVFLLHTPLAFYTSIYIIYQQILKMFGRKPVLKAYGKSEILDKIT